MGSITHFIRHALLAGLVSGCGDVGWNDLFATSLGDDPRAQRPAPARTFATPDGRLAVHVTVPMRVDACRPLEPLGIRCDDIDEDDLVDAWEDALLGRLTPVVRFADDEPAFTDPEARFAAVGRVAPRHDGHILVVVTLLYTHDYGSCGVGAHPGDAERVALLLEPYEDHDVVVTAVFLAAHEGGARFGPGELHHMRYVDDGNPAYASYDQRSCGAEPRWLVFSSKGKHATYVSAQVCEDARKFICLEEDCGAPYETPQPFDRTPPVFNAGEPEHPRLQELDPIGFAGDHAWLDQRFCGGVGKRGCPPSVRSKLLDDPF